MNTGAAQEASSRWRRRSIVALVVCAVAVAGGATVLYRRNLTDDAYAAMARGQFRRAFDFYQTTAETGDSNAMNSVANLYYLGLGVERDFGAANRWYRRAAEHGHAAAQINLGHLYKQGLGVVADPVRAFGWYNMAHIHGSPAAENFMTQIAVEHTLSPLMIESAMERWAKLPDLMNEEP